MSIASVFANAISEAAKNAAKPCQCPVCKDEAPKSLEGIRLHLAEMLEKLNGVAPLVPVPGRMYRTLSGREVIVALDQDAEGDFIVLDVKTGDRATILKTGEPFYKDFGEFLAQGISRCWVLVEELSL